MSFKIKNEQMVVLRNKNYEEFVMKCLKILEANYHHLVNLSNTEEVETQVKRLLTLSTKIHGITTPKSMFEYCLLAMEFPVLDSEELPPNLKEIVKWPGRKDERKIELLKMQLIK